MKFAICSDLHLEFADIDLKNEESADVLILSGDILIERDLDMFDRRQVEFGFARERSTKFHHFFERVCSEFPKVIYIAGNHEHYHGDFKHTLNELKRKLARYENLHVLDKECVTVGDVTIIGGTLWTDMNKRDPLTLYHVKHMMNDFQCVENSNKVVYRKVPVYKKDENGAYIRNENGGLIEEGMKMKEETAKFSPEDAADDHNAMMDYIEEIILDKDDQKFVVVGHHTPSMQSCSEYYRGDEIMNGAYHTELGWFIADHPQIKLWTHGHTHEEFDYVIGETRVICNPRGYKGHEQRAEDFKLKYVEV